MLIIFWNYITFFKETMVSPYILTYHQHFENHLKEVTSKSRVIEPERLLAAIDHLRSVTCTPFDFQKADMLLKV